MILPLVFCPLGRLYCKGLCCCFTRTMERWQISWVSTHCPLLSWITPCTAVWKQHTPSIMCTPPLPCLTWCTMPSFWPNRCVPLPSVHLSPKIFVEIQWNVYLGNLSAFCFSWNLFIQKGFDVFNALDLMENKTFLEKLKFGVGDGNLQYYLYNWKCPSMGSEKVTFLAGGEHYMTRGK